MQTCIFEAKYQIFNNYRIFTYISSKGYFKYDFFEGNAYDFLGMYEKYQVIVFVEVQLIKITFFKDEQTRSTQNVVNTSMFKSEYYSIYKYEIFTHISSKGIFE